MTDIRQDPARIGETICKDCRHNPLALNLDKLPEPGELMAHIQACTKCHRDPLKHEGYAKIGGDELEVVKAKRRNRNRLER